MLEERFYVLKREVKKRGTASRVVVKKIKIRKKFTFSETIKGGNRLEILDKMKRGDLIEKYL